MLGGGRAGMQPRRAKGAGGPRKFVCQRQRRRPVGWRCAGGGQQGRDLGRGVLAQPFQRPCQAVIADGRAQIGKPDGIGQRHIRRRRGGPGRAGCLFGQRDGGGPRRACGALLEKGIAVIIEPRLDGTHLDGSALLGAGGRPVIGLPGCARSPALNGADWVLNRLACGLEVSDDDIAAMGLGGLLKESPLRPHPRDG